MSRAAALAIVTALWAAIFLPGLGSTELKGEEGRRVLPAMTMLETGDWIVPRIGGEPYLRKPPLINWLAAISMRACGVRNEWATRLPSVLAVLALALAMVWLGAAWLGAPRALLAALFTLTNISTIEKGRLIEIEAIYVALTGAAIFCWLGWWVARRSLWLTWVAPFVLLGLAHLLKGPLHLLFFYAVAVAVLWRAGEMRQLWSMAHVAGVIVMLAIFAAWWWPYHLRPETSEAAEVWRGQFAGRLGGAFDLKGWLSNIPRGLINWLPWVLFVPLWWRKSDGGGAAVARRAALFRGCRLATVACFFGLLILPGVLPRYTLPLMVPASVLLAMSVGNPGRWQRATLGWGAACGVAMALFALLVVPRMRAAENVRPLGEAIDAAVPPGAPLWAVNPGFQPAFFYVRRPVSYAEKFADVPAGAAHVLVRGKSLGKAHEYWPSAHKLGEFEDKDGRQFFLLNTAGR